jgi:hypothetical protein
MSLYEYYQLLFMRLSFCLNLITIIILVFTLFFYYKQFKSLNDQLIVLKAGEASKNILSIILFLQDTENRDSRDHVINKLHGKEPKNYTKKDKDHASRVCSSYGTVGGLFKSKIDLNKMIIFEGYGPSIVRCHEILKSYIKEKRNDAGPTYWINFDYLYDETTREIPSLLD